ncbi:ENTH/VHS domain-containing protein [Schizosaccharomyces japonicus yFS275]|uniref:ENTH/VHS domain-containing protein n=1 Tax=Schizosaccharomyces japonicus (strain yFS275 / FY16936) TaxID=402676 RepID=B6JYT0_SCHJY|nr:ENTH/VHS domain-containing protein [Schizosaccharomyces japonicus yFS275]EEB06698.1 ENTH/VHS domain-containing protein [Schizosaccharomyces japonicus yFS275]
MFSTYEKSVKKATKIKLAAPKSKHVENLLKATQQGGPVLESVVNCLCERLKNNSWTIVFKALIVFHILIRDGAPNAVIECLTRRDHSLEVLKATALTTQGENIHNYSQYLQERVKQYSRLSCDYARQGDGPKAKLKGLTVERGLLRNVEGIQAQLRRLLKCEYMVEEVDNDITITSFRLLVADLLSLFKAVNLGVINVLEHYFEMSYVDAEHALKIYKCFVTQTETVIHFLSFARSLEFVTRLQVPNIKHAPTGLTSSLEEYLQDPNFESNRQQYMDMKRSKSKQRPPNIAPRAEAPEKPFRKKPPVPEPQAAAPAYNGASLKDTKKEEDDRLNPFLNSSYQHVQSALAEPLTPMSELTASTEYMPQKVIAPVGTPGYMANPYAIQQQQMQQPQMQQPQPSMNVTNPFFPTIGQQEPALQQPPSLPVSPSFPPPPSSIQQQQPLVQPVMPMYPQQPMLTGAPPPVNIQTNMYTGAPAPMITSPQPMMVAQNNTPGYSPMSFQTNVNNNAYNRRSTPNLIQTPPTTRKSSNPFALRRTSQQFSQANWRNSNNPFRPA